MALPYLVTYQPLGRRRGNGPYLVGLLIVVLAFFGGGTAVGTEVGMGSTLGSVLGGWAGTGGCGWVG